MELEVNIIYRRVDVILLKAFERRKQHVFMLIVYTYITLEQLHVAHSNL